MLLGACQLTSMPAVREVIHDLKFLHNTKDLLTQGFWRLVCLAAEVSYQSAWADTTEKPCAIRAHIISSYESQPMYDRFIFQQAWVEKT